MKILDFPSQTHTFAKGHDLTTDTCFQTGICLYFEMV